MKRLLPILLIIISINTYMSCQDRPISQIEGILEVYDNIDSSSLYLGKNVGRNLDSCWYFFEHPEACQKIFNNTFIGTQAGELNKEGRGNTFVGFQSGTKNISGVSNSFFGAFSGIRNTIGQRNTFVGHASGLFSTTGNSNALYGYSSGNSGGGSENSYYGALSGRGNNGDGNTAIGYRSGDNVRNGNKNITIGYQSGPRYTTNNISNRLYIDIEPSDTPLIYGDFEKDSIVINGDLAVQGSIIGSITADSMLAILHLGENDDKGITFSENTNPVFGIIYDGEGAQQNNRFHIKKFLGGTESIATFTGYGTVGIGTETPHALLHIQGAVDANLENGGHLMTGSVAGINIIMDNNEIMARNNSQASTLYLNKDSGEVVMGGKIRVANDPSNNQPGQIRYNTTTSDFEGYDGNNWYSLTSNKSSIVSIVSDPITSTKSMLTSELKDLKLENEKLRLRIEHLEKK